MVELGNAIETLKALVTCNHGLRCGNDGATCDLLTRMFVRKKPKYCQDEEKGHPDARSHLPFGRSPGDI